MKSIFVVLSILLLPYFALGSNSEIFISSFDSGVSQSFSTNLYYVDQLQLEEAWKLTTGNPEVRVAILSTGVNYRLPILASTILKNKGEMGEGRENDGIDNDGNGFIDDVYGYDTMAAKPDPLDRHGIGTHAASLIHSIAPNVKIIPVKVFSDSGIGSFYSILAGVQYALVRGANLILHQGGGTRGKVGSKDVCDALNEVMGSERVMFIGPTANEGNRIDDSFFPVGCSLPNKLMVTATDSESKLASFASWNEYLVDLGAPGVSIPGIIHDGSVQSYSGSSSSSAIAAGVTALVMSYNLDASLFNVREAILGGVDINDTLVGKTVSGGRINALNALNLLNP